MRNSFLLIVSLLWLTSCITSKKCARKFPPKEFDSITTIHNVEYRDTVVYDTLPGERITIDVPVACPDIFLRGSQKSDNLHINYLIEKNKLKIICNSDSLIKDIKLKNKVITDLKTHFKSSTRIMEIYKIPAYCWLIIGSLCFAIIVLLFRL